MCSHYQGIKSRDQFERHFGILPAVGDYPVDVWPSYLAPFVRPHPHADAGDEAVPPLEAPLGAFGLLPHWAKDRSASRHTYNARTETVAQKPSFRDAWARAQHCIIPAEAIFEPDWRSGRAVSTRISLANGEPMGIAGLWSAWRGPQGEVQDEGDGEPTAPLAPPRSKAPAAATLPDFDVEPPALPPSMAGRSRSPRKTRSAGPASFAAACRRS
jgi:putative SOS response-associated peptidase YedK